MQQASRACSEVWKPGSQTSGRWRGRLEIWSLPGFKVQGSEAVDKVLSFPMRPLANMQVVNGTLAP